MGHKIFVSYKYADANVQALPGLYTQTTVRSYVDKFEYHLHSRGSSIYKGERNGTDLSMFSEDYIWQLLKDKIYDSTVTVLFISPNMKEYGKWERSQWIPWEIAYSLREQTRSDRTSHSNAIVAVILPDKAGNYGYYSWMNHFKIVSENIKNGYIEVVEWANFISNTTRYIDAAIRRKENTPKYQLVKTV